MTIWKFPLDIADFVHITMPRGATPLSVQMQNGTPCVWALVDPGAEQVGRVFHVRGTGHDIIGNVGHFLGTVQRGPYVWHVFYD